MKKHYASLKSAVLLAFHLVFLGSLATHVANAQAPNVTYESPINITTGGTY